MFAMQRLRAELSKAQADAKAAAEGQRRATEAHRKALEQATKFHEAASESKAGCALLHDAALLMFCFRQAGVCLDKQSLPGGCAAVPELLCRQAGLFVINALA
jgi:hypothetical protein